MVAATSGPPSVPPEPAGRRGQRLDLDHDLDTWFREFPYEERVPALHVARELVALLRDDAKLRARVLQGLRRRS